MQNAICLTYSCTSQGLLSLIVKVLVIILWTIADSNRFKSRWLVGDQVYELIMITICKKFNVRSDDK